MLTRIFGRKKYGKTEYCMKILKKCVEDKKKCYFVVPEQFSFSCEKRITDEIGNRANMYAEVLSFTRLCSRVLRYFGKMSEGYLDSVGKLLCMSRVMKTLSNELCEYGDSAQDISFAAAAVGTVEEFSSYGINAKKIESILPELERENPSLCLKLKDMTLLSAAYHSELKANYGTDGESLDMLCTVLDKNNFFEGSVIIIDSFYGFTPQELKIVRHMIRQADDVYITFCTAKDDKDPVFKRPKDAADSIYRVAKENSISVVDECLAAPPYNDDISYLERKFSTSLFFNAENHENARNGKNVGIIRCRNQIDEAKAVAAEIYSLISDGKTHFRDIAVCARSIASYEGIIDVFLEKSNIPFTFSASEDLHTKPIISYILTAIDIISGWKQQSFICILKTGLFSVSADDIALLENYIRTWNINGKKEFNTEWYMNPSGYSAVFSEKDSEILNKVNQAKTVVMDAIIKFSEDISDAVCCRDIAAAVYRLMCDSSYREKLENSDDARFWNLTIQAIDEIVKVYGYDDMSAKNFAELFKSVITEYGVLNIPERIDSVLIGSVDLIRSETIKYMFVLGCNNEYFPLQKAEDSIFSDGEKNILHSKGIDISPPAADCAYDEFFLAYNIFCDPYEKLFLLYSEADLDGKKLRKSVLADTVGNVFSGNIEISYPFECEAENITTLDSLADDMYYIGGAVFTEAAKTVISEKSNMKSIFLREGELLNENGKISYEYSKRLFGETVCSSPSRFECYSSCRFNYFNRYILKILPEKKAELDSLQTGLISHKVLEIFVKELADAKISGNMLTHDDAEKRICEILGGHFLAITHTKHERNDAISKRFEYLYNRLSSILTTLARYLVDEVSQSDFIPEDFEINIGVSDGMIKSVPIDIKDDNGKKLGELRIVGQVDRADVFRKDGNTYVRIIDYKTGPKSFRKENVDYGFNLQMLLYLYCITLSETKRYGENVIPAGVLYVPVRKPEVNDAVLSDDIREKAAKLSSGAFKGDGLLIDKMEVLEAMEKGINGKYIPVSITKKGDFSVYSKVESLEKMGELLERAAKVSGKLASLMYTGNIQTNPYKNDMSSCAMCDYGAVCRLDRKNDNIRYSFEEVDPK